MMRTAKGVITNYVGGSKGLTGDSDQGRHYAQYQSMISRDGLGINLSKGQRARRVNVLIDGDKLHDAAVRVTHEHRTKAAMDAFQFAREWWTEHGVPIGFDLTNSACELLSSAAMTLLPNSLSASCWSASAT